MRDWFGQSATSFEFGIFSLNFFYKFVLGFSLKVRYAAFSFVVGLLHKVLLVLIFLDIASRFPQKYRMGSPF